MLILVKGAGDLASAVALRLFRAGYNVVMTEISVPTTVRRTVAFSRAVYEKNIFVEDVQGILVDSSKEALEVVKDGKIAVIVDEDCRIRDELKPEVIVDAIIAKKNLGTRINDANLVIGVGPGFTPKLDCHAVIETQRGHYLGRAYRDKPAAENTGIPGMIGGHSIERIIRSKGEGIFEPLLHIGDTVSAGDLIAYSVNNGERKPIIALIDGVIRGLLQEGVTVFEGMKAGDIDPRCKVEHCATVSDKGSAIGGGVLEVVSNYYINLRKDV